jgi:hypothetical protein
MMEARSIEAWALRVISALGKGKPNEDSSVELKSEWIQPAEAARRIAGHANAAGGGPILWLIGIDRHGQFTNPEPKELANWHAGVVANFDGIAPPMRDVLVVVSQGIVVALQFDTDRAPFVVKNPAFGQSPGPVSREVPFREGTAVRSATRNDLLQILVSPTLLPSIELVNGDLVAEPFDDDVARVVGTQLVLRAWVYVTPRSPLTVIPFHRCRGTIAIESIPVADLNIFAFPSSGHSPAIDSTQNEVTIRGPGMVIIKGIARILRRDVPALVASAHLDLHVVDASGSLTLDFELGRVEDLQSFGDVGKWILGRH